MRQIKRIKTKIFDPKPSICYRFAIDSPIDFPPYPLICHRFPIDYQLIPRSVHCFAIDSPIDSPTPRPFPCDHALELSVCDIGFSAFDRADVFSEGVIDPLARAAAFAVFGGKAGTEHDRIISFLFSRNRGKAQDHVRSWDALRVKPGVVRVCEAKCHISVAL